MKPRSVFTRAARNIQWMETYCAIRIPDPDRAALRAIYNDFQNDTETTRETAACMVLLHVCGPEAVPDTQIYAPGLWWRAARLAKQKDLAECLEVTQGVVDRVPRCAGSRWLIAVVGHRGAAVLLRNLATAIEAEAD